RRNHQQKRQQTFSKSSYRSSFFDHQHRGPDNYRELGELRRLQRATEQISARTVNAWSDRSREGKDHDDEQHERENHRGPGPFLPHFRVHPGGDGEERNANGHSDELTNE